MIAPIRTWYRDVYYRSRTEARWAVFFDEMGVATRYECEGYRTQHGFYLPDFRLSDAPEPTLFEVKSGPATRQEMDMMSALVRQLGAHLFVSEGGPAADCVVWKVLADRTRTRWEFGVAAVNGELRLVREGEPDVFMTMMDYDDWRSGWDADRPAWEELECAANYQFPIHDDPQPRFHRNRPARGIAKGQH